MTLSSPSTVTHPYRFTTNPPINSRFPCPISICAHSLSKGTPLLQIYARVSGGQLPPSPSGSKHSRYVPIVGLLPVCSHRANWSRAGLAGFEWKSSKTYSTLRSSQVLARCTLSILNYYIGIDQKITSCSIAVLWLNLIISLPRSKIVNRKRSEMRVWKSSRCESKQKQWGKVKEWRAGNICAPWDLERNKERELTRGEVARGKDCKNFLGLLFRPTVSIHLTGERGLRNERPRSCAPLLPSPLVSRRID